MENFEVDGNFLREVDDSFVRESRQFDMTLILKRHKIQVSKVVLSVASPVFRAMFESDFKEIRQDEIELRDKEYADIAEFLSCIYPDKYADITKENVYRILPLASEYQVKVLQKRCQSFLMRQVKKCYCKNIDEICRHIQLSEIYHLEELNKTCTILASSFSLAELGNAMEKHQITDSSSTQIHYHARISEEHALKQDDLNRRDDDILRKNSRKYDKSSFLDIIKAVIESRLNMFKGNVAYTTTDKLVALRLCHRFFKHDQQLFDRVVENVKIKMQSDKSAQTRGPNLKEELDLLPEEIKVKLNIK